MKTFYVDVVLTHSELFSVTAETPDEAKKIAEEAVNNGAIDVAYAETSVEICDSFSPEELERMCLRNIPDDCWG